MALNVNEARKLVLDLGQPNLKIYWLDFILSYSLGVATFLLAYPHPLSSPLFWGWALLSSLALYRAMIFIHEIVHFKQRLGSFTIFWNAVAGVPMAFPSFMYARSHAIHHNPNTYGTSADGEYVSFQTRSRWQIVAYLASSFFSAPALIIRFAFLYPVSLIVPAVRKFVVEKGSSVIISMDYVGHWPKGAEKREWFIMETACCVFWLCVLTAAYQGVVPWRLLGVLYLVMSLVLFLNNIRTLAAHRFANTGRVLTLEEQLLDSVNIVSGFPHWIFSALAAPVGLRYHALHHLFPFLPYHALGAAHKRLASKLPKDSVYHYISEPSMMLALLKIFRREGVPTIRRAEAQ